jgi:hypothetical protein
VFVRNNAKVVTFQASSKTNNIKSCLELVMGKIARAGEIINVFDRFIIEQSKAGERGAAAAA